MKVPRGAALLLLALSLAVAAVWLSAPGHGLRSAGESARTEAPGLLESDLEAQSRELDRQLQGTDAHWELLTRLSADLIAGRRTLPEAAGSVAAFSRQRKPAWLRAVRRLYPNRPEEASVAAALVYFTLSRPRGGGPPDEDPARRLAGDYRLRYGLPLTVPGGAPIPPCRRAAGLVRAEGS
jgi:hypothetical protein